MNTILKQSNILKDVSLINELASSTGLNPKLVEILVSRGYDNQDKIQKFLRPEEQKPHDPYLLSGMKELSNRLNQAIASGETIIVYGDYDVDGICAVAVMTDFLLGRGANVIPYVPNRHNEGYGLSEGVIERMIEEYLPDLIVTCDCGISSCAEIKFAIDLGVDVVVTDHHEIPPVCPDCIVVNPKIKGHNYPFELLCGAGVVLKVVQAIGGMEEASKYLDLCALATVADMVPLIDENRTIVTLGLKKINSGNLNPGLKGLLDYVGRNGEVTSCDLAFKVAPMINAAGRMGDAGRAFRLLSETDSKVIFDLIKDLSLDNQKRKETCENVYKEATQILTREDLINNYAIILSHQGWERGLTSIVAAQLAGEYNRPVFLLVETQEDVYKGTARSVDNVNLYELLTTASDLLIEFGGHTQAAGFSIQKSNLPAFKKRINDYLKQNYSAEYFLPYAYYDAAADINDFNIQLAKEIDKLEPFGLGNQRPVFLMKTDNLKAKYLKNKSRHLLIQTGGKQKLIAFEYGNYLETLNSKADFSLAFTVSVNKYKNNEYLNISLKDLDYDCIKGINSSQTLDAEWLKGIRLGIGNFEPAPYKEINTKDLSGVIDNSRVYGTLIAAYDFESYKEIIESGYINKHYIHNYINSTTPNNYNRITLGLDISIPLKNYDTIILAERPAHLGFINFLYNLSGGANIYVCEKDISGRILPALQTGREVFAAVYSSISRAQEIADNFYDYYKSTAAKQGISFTQFVLCLEVFCELGLVEADYKQFGVKINECQKVELSDSEILRYIGQTQKRENFGQF